MEAISISLYNDSEIERLAPECKLGGFGIEVPETNEKPNVVFPGGYNLSSDANELKRIYGEPSDMWKFEFEDATVPEEYADDVEIKDDFEFEYENDPDSEKPTMYFSFDHGLNQPCREASYDTATYEKIYNEEMEREELL
jgi:hypothetical protein